MQNKILQIWKQYKYLLVSMVLWGLLWLFPWTTWLSAFPWIRLIVSMVIFILPGMIVSLLLADNEFNLPTHFVNGVGFSIFIVGSLGLLGRVFNLPFSYIKPVFALIGLIGMFLLIRYARLGKQFYRIEKLSKLTIISVVVLIGLGVVISLTQNTFGGDDFHYLVYLTNWQHAQPLGFQEVYLASGELDRVRYWLNMFPMNMAFLAELSDLHGLLLIGYYIEPIFIGLSIFGFFNLFNHFLQSERKAIAALYLQFTAFIVFQGSYQFGSSYFKRLSEDKAFAAYILIPIFFIAVHHYLKSRTVRSGMYLLLIGWGLALTHPILLAYSIFISGIYAGFVSLFQKEYKRLAIVALIMVAILLPVASLRFVEVPWVYQNLLGMTNRPKMTNNFDLDTALSNRPDISDTRISYIEGTPFYGLNLNVIKLQKISVQSRLLKKAINWSYIYIVLIGFIWSLFNLRKHYLAPFVTASTLLIIVCGIPYTGWLVGYFVTARMLWRAPWAIQIGLICYILLSEMAKVFIKKSSLANRNLLFVQQNTFRILIVLCYMVIGYYSFSIYKVNWNKVTSNDNNYLNELKKLVEVGDYIENNIEHPVTFAAARRNMMNYLPGLSSKAKSVVFRGGGKVVGERDYNRQGPIFSKDTSISVRRRMKVMNQYHIEYLLVQDKAIKDFYASYPEHFNIEKVSDFWVVEFRSAIH